MSAEISFLRNLDTQLINNEGEVLDAVALCTDSNNTPVCLQLPMMFDNDLELLYVFGRAFNLLQKIDKVSANIKDYSTVFNISEKESELLKQCHGFTNFILTTFFSANGNMVRFNLDKNLISIYFVKNQKNENILYFHGNIIELLPDIFMQYNISKLRKDIQDYSQILKGANQCNLIKEKQQKLDQLEDAFIKKHNLEDAISYIRS